MREWIEWILEIDVYLADFASAHGTLVYALLYAQGILPKYTLDPVAATTRRAAARLTSKELAPPRTARKRAARKGPARPRAARKHRTKPGRSLRR